jgi:hypothetical protein
VVIGADDVIIMNENMIKLQELVGTMVGTVTTAAATAAATGLHRA